MAVALQLLAHALVAIFLGLLATLTLFLVVRSQDFWERNLRIVAILTGALLYISGQMVGVSASPFFIVTSPGSYLNKILSILLPLVVGSCLGWLIMSVSRSSSRANVRLTLVLLTWAVMASVDFWISSIKLGWERSPALLPLISLVIGFSLFVITTFHSVPEHDK